jgi:hypothetical protein
MTQTLSIEIVPYGKLTVLQATDVPISYPVTLLIPVSSQVEV